MYSPGKYDTLNKMQRGSISELIEEFAEELMTMSGQCMDIGCGPGGMTKNILMPALPPNTTILGTDVSAGMVSYANKVYADNVRLTFDILDIQTKNLPEEYFVKFDHVFSFYALHWCSDIRQAFNNIYHMLRPGGSMLVLLAPSHDIFNIYKLLAHDNRYTSYIPDVTKMFSALCLSANPRQELKDLLINIGFKIRHYSQRRAVSIDENHTKTLDSIMHCTLLPHKMPQDLEIQFWKDVKCEYMKRQMCLEKVKNNAKQTVIVDLFKTLVVYASK